MILHIVIQRTSTSIFNLAIQLNNRFYIVHFWINYIWELLPLEVKLLIVKIFLDLELDFGLDLFESFKALGVVSEDGELSSHGEVVNQGVYVCVVR